MLLPSRDQAQLTSRALHLEGRQGINKAHLDRTEVGHALAGEIEEAERAIFAGAHGGVVVGVALHHPHGATVGITLRLDAELVEV